jgi:hypothetical protein
MEQPFANRTMWILVTAILLGVVVLEILNHRSIDQIRRTENRLYAQFAFDSCTFSACPDPGDPNVLDIQVNGDPSCNLFLTTVPSFGMPSTNERMSLHFEKISVATPVDYDNDATVPSPLGRHVYRLQGGSSYKVKAGLKQDGVLLPFQSLNMNFQCGESINYPNQDTAFVRFGPPAPAMAIATVSYGFWGYWGGPEPVETPFP